MHQLLVFLRSLVAAAQKAEGIEKAEDVTIKELLVVVWSFNDFFDGKYCVRTELAKPFYADLHAVVKLFRTSFRKSVFICGGDHVTWC